MENRTTNAAPRRAVATARPIARAEREMKDDAVRAASLGSKAPAPQAILKDIAQQLDGVLSRLRTLSDRVKSRADYTLGQIEGSELSAHEGMPVPDGRVHELGQLASIAHNLLSEVEYQVGRLETL